ncbi:hypothetical protein [Micropruina sp.]|uniref:hypothetical protein n=1 Tax=Micropruina sp. TaxID=2737536 RepID=UPI0039E57A33
MTDGRQRLASIGGIGRSSHWGISPWARDLSLHCRKARLRVPTTRLGRASVHRGDDMAKKSLGFGRLLALFASVALIGTFAQFPTAARADTKPLDETNPKTPVTVSADPLPTAQIDGVAWTQLVVGNTVYVGGSFTTARPAGSAAGVDTVTRTNLLAYDITTGVLSTTWAPTTNGEVLTMTASPDKSRIYIGGSFTQVNGSIRNRIAALDPTTGALVNAFQPKPDASVKSIVATSSTVYFGGIFSSVGGTTRAKIAAVQASDGALLSWVPTIAGGNVNAMKLSPDGTKIALGGSFTTVNGSSNPGYGLAFVTPDTGESLAMPVNATVRNGGDNAAILSLTSDSDSLYATGYTYGSGGNLEGTTRIDWSDGSLVWVEDCHGDTYGSYPMGDVVYTVSHAHYCGNLEDGFGQTAPSWTFHWGNAFFEDRHRNTEGGPARLRELDRHPGPVATKVAAQPDQWHLHRSESGRVDR